MLRAACAIFASALLVVGCDNHPAPKDQSTQESLPICTTQSEPAAVPTWQQLRAADIRQLKACRIFDPNQFLPTWGNVDDRKVKAQAQLTSAEIAQVARALRTSTTRQPTCINRERPLKTGFLIYYLAEGERHPFQIVLLADQTCAGFQLPDGARYSKTLRRVLDRLTPITSE